MSVIMAGSILTKDGQGEIRKQIRAIIVRENVVI